LRLRSAPSGRGGCESWSGADRVEGAWIAASPGGRIDQCSFLMRTPRAPRDQARYDAAPLLAVRPWRRRRHGLFRTVKLNLVGWSAVLGVGLAAAIILRLFRVRVAPAVLIGELGTVSVLKALDYRRWRRTPVTFSVDAPKDVVRALVAEMQERGLPLTYESVPYDDDETSEYRPGMGFRRAAEKKVRAELRRRGL